MKVSHKFVDDSAMFDEDNLVSCAGLVPVMTLAEHTHLSDLLAEKVSITTTKVASGAANPAPKLLTLIAGMCAGADSIDDIDLLRSGGMTHPFRGVYAPSTVGILLCEFSFGHARQVESVLRDHLIALTARVEILPGLAEQAFIDIDSLLRPVYGHAKQGASYGHTKIAGTQLLRTGLSPLATTLSTADSTPIITGMRLPAGKAGSGKGAGRMVHPGHRHRPGSGRNPVPSWSAGDSAYDTRAVISACLRAKADFSLVPGQEHRDPTRDRRDRRRGVDPGEISRCGPRPGHRSLDLKTPRSPKPPTPRSRRPRLRSLHVRRLDTGRSDETPRNTASSPARSD